ncbi:MAG: nucleotidyl transferase AbiEii/AbiGii toxin family protein [Deltaproteobacteria bacterium]|nr:MAG: nucleotidyl transferase AbiEii/AbiGii toxin family protein [Deltaproteobacteria bacterium]
MKTLVQKDPRFNINELRVIVGLERAIARLSQHKNLAEHLIFKGGFVLLKSYESLRFTRDADALAVSISKEKLKDLVSAALKSDLEDGLWFGDVQVKELTEQGEYGAYRFDAAFQIGEPNLKKLSNLSRIHIDVGFNDQLPTKPDDQIMPSILEHEEPVTWKVYPIEYIVAEKVQTLFGRGSANSRAKDVYDLVYLLPRCKDRVALISAIRKTFEHRQTPLPDSFAKEADLFDKTILSHGWPGVRILEEKMGFEEVWKALMNLFKEFE